MDLLTSSGPYFGPDWVQVKYFRRKGVFCISDQDSTAQNKIILFLGIFPTTFIPKISRVGDVLGVESWFSAHLKFYRTSSGKSTFRTQNGTDKTNFRCKVAKKVFHFELIQNTLLPHNFNRFSHNQSNGVKNKFKNPKLIFYF